MALSRKKKNSLTLLLLTILLVAGGIIYVVISQKKDEGPTDTTPEPTHSLTLSEIAVEDIDHITIVNGTFNGTINREVKDVNGEKVTEYSLEGKTDFPLDQAKAELIFKNSALAAKEFVTAEGDPAEFGLAGAKIKAEIVSTTGKTVVLAVGDAVGMTDKGGFYVNVNGGSEIYLTQTDMKTAFSYSETDLIEKAIPVIDTTNVDEVIIEVTEKGKTETTVFLHDSAGVAALYGAAYMNWFVVDATGRKLLADDELATKYVEDNYAQMYVSTAIDYKPENFAKYGLDAPTGVITINLTEKNEEGEKTGSKQYKLLVGASYNDEYHYVTLEGDTRTYLMPLSRLKSMFEISLASYLDKYFCVMNMSTVAGLEISFNGVTNRYTLTQKKETDENGKEKVTLDTVSKNGTLMENTTAFTGFYTNLALQTWKGLVEDTEENATVLLELKYTRTSEDYLPMNYTFESYNDNYVAIRINGVRTYTLSKSAYDSIVKLIP